MTKTDTATYRELIEVTRSIDQKIDKLALDISENYVKKSDLVQVLKDVDALKAWRFYFTGFSAAIGAVVGLLADKIKV